MGITAIPMLVSLYLSFTNYDLLTPLSEVQWVGLDNYERMFTADPSYWHAVAGHADVRAGRRAAEAGRRARRGAAAQPGAPRRRRCSAALFYLPSLLGGSVALAIVWVSMFNRDGAFNAFLALFGIEGTAVGQRPATGRWRR